MVTLTAEYRAPGMVFTARDLSASGIVPRKLIADYHTPSTTSHRAILLFGTEDEAVRRTNREVAATYGSPANARRVAFRGLFI